MNDLLKFDPFQMENDHLRKVNAGGTNMFTANGANGAAGSNGGQGTTNIYSPQSQTLSKNDQVYQTFEFYSDRIDIVTRNYRGVEVNRYCIQTSDLSIF